MTGPDPFSILKREEEEEDPFAILKKTEKKEDSPPSSMSLPERAFHKFMGAGFESLGKTLQYPKRVVSAASEVLDKDKSLAPSPLRAIANVFKLGTAPIAKLGESPELWGKTIKEQVPEAKGAVEKVTDFASEMAGIVGATPAPIRGVYTAVSAVSEVSGLARITGRWADDIAKSLAKSPSLAKHISGAVRASSVEVPTGLIIQDMLDPGSLKTKEGLAWAGGFAVFDSWLGGLLGQARKATKASDLTDIVDALNDAVTKESPLNPKQKKDALAVIEDIEALRMDKINEELTAVEPPAAPAVITPEGVKIYPNPAAIRKGMTTKQQLNIIDENIKPVQEAWFMATDQAEKDKLMKEWKSLLDYREKVLEEGFSDLAPSALETTGEVKDASGNLIIKRLEKGEVLGGTAEKPVVERKGEVKQLELFVDPNPEPLALLSNDNLPAALGRDISGYPTYAEVDALYRAKRAEEPIPSKVDTEGLMRRAVPPPPPSIKRGNLESLTPEDHLREAKARVRRRIVHPGEHSKFRDRIPWSERFRKFSRQFEAVLGVKHTLQKANVANPETHQAYLLARLLSDNSARAEHFANLEVSVPVYGSLTDYEVLPVRPIKKIVDELGNNAERVNDFLDLLVARHTLDEGILFPKAEHILKQPEEAILTGIGVQDARLLVASADDQLLNLANEWRANMDAVATYAVNALAFSKSKKTILDNLYKYFVPLSRLVNNPERAATIFKRQKGSERPILNPIETALENISATIEAAERNKMWRALTNEYHRNPDAFEEAGLITEIKDPIAVNATFKEEIERFQKGYSEIVGSELSTSEAMELVLSFSKKNLDMSDGTITVYRYGLGGANSVKKYRIGPELQDFVKSMSAHEVSKVVTWIAAFSKPVRKIVSITLDVTGINPLIRDPLYAYFHDDFGFKPYVDTWEGFFENLSKGELHRERARVGGELFGRYGAPEQASSEHFFPLSSGKKLKVILTSPLDAIQKVIQPISDANRMGYYMRMRDNGMSPHMAAVLSRNVLGGDWGQPGASLLVKGLVRTVEFSNVGIKSIGDYYSILARAKSSPKAATKLAAKLVSGITLPSFLAWYLGKDDEDLREYRNSPVGNRNIAFRVPGTDNVLAFPIPGYFFGAVFGTGFINALDRMYSEEGPNSMKPTIDALAQELGVNFIPLVPKAAISIYANKDVRSDNPITPLRELRQLPADRASRMSSNFSRNVAMLGEKVGVQINPIYLDYAISQFTGTEGSKIFNSLDRMGQFDGVSRPGMVLSDTPLLGRYFARIPSTGGMSVREFYTEYRKHSQVMASLEGAKRDFNSNRLLALLTSKGDYIARAPMYAQAAQTINSMYTQAHMYSKMPDEILSPREKEKLITDVARNVTEYTRMFNQAARKLK